MRREEIEFLRQSNYMEGERSMDALVNAEFAWEFAKNYHGKINVPFVLGIHERLMKRLNPRIAGRIRDVDVYVTNARYPCLDKDDVKNYLNAWVNVANKPLWDIEDLHLTFMIIHPFEDGNGRTGRILMNAQRLRNNLPIFILNERDKNRYYQHHLIKKRKPFFGR